MADISKIQTNGTTYDIKDAEARDDISSLNDDLTNCAYTNFFNGTVDDMLTDWASMPARANLFGCSGACAQFLTNSTTSAVWWGIRARSGSNLEYLIFAGNNGVVYYGRVADGAVTVLRSISGSSISLSSVGEPVVMEDGE